jgi:hypothetical protein
VGAAGPPVADEAVEGFGAKGVVMSDEEEPLPEEEMQALARRAADDPEAADQLWEALGE